MGDSSWIPVARLTRPHGVRGAMKVYPYGESLASKGAGEEVFAGPSEKEARRLTLDDLRPQGRFLVVRFREVTRREEAEALAGAEIFLPARLLPPLEDGEYYHFQLLGLRVETESGDALGRLKAVLETGAHDVYAVEDDGGGEWLLPAVEEVVLRVDLEAGCMIVAPPPGLRE